MDQVETTIHYYAIAKCSVWRTWYTVAKCVVWRTLYTTALNVVVWRTLYTVAKRGGLENTIH